jgi:hypothetical protein
MRTLLSGLAGAIIVTLLSLCAHCAERNTDFVAKEADRVRAVLPGASELPVAGEGQVYDLSHFSLTTPLAEVGYKPEPPRDSFFGIRAVGRYIDLVSVDETKRPKVEILLQACHGSPQDAQVMMLCAMAATSMMITESTYDRVVEGPGEACFTWATAAARDDDLGVAGTLWFYRQSVAVTVRCKDGTADLLPIARAIDAALKACPVVGTDELNKTLPDITVAQPVPIGDPDEETYRIDFAVPLPLAEHQRVVAVSLDRSVQVVLREGHVVAKRQRGDEQAPPRIFLGVYDGKRVWVKWHDEPASREVQDDE